MRAKSANKQMSFWWRRIDGASTTVVVVRTRSRKKANLGEELLISDMLKSAKWLTGISCAAWVAIGANA